MQDRPTAAELLDALGGFLRDRAQHARDRWERFQFLVAANSLSILKREAEQEEDAILAEWERLDALLGPERLPLRFRDRVARLRERNAELCEAIRAGRFDGEREQELKRHLYLTVVDKVRIASPNELDEERTTG
ncbi:MAG: DUF6285 domain-containing protein [Chloroflexota bacterium]|nr:DUF6285 domain-containing protein [Dehalococcoidia bacterium]MDW8045687.1 DUF6285 domain-containing protein [Chloroflexota bacterium]